MVQCFFAARRADCCNFATLGRIRRFLPGRKRFGQWAWLEDLIWPPPYSDMPALCFSQMRASDSGWYEGNYLPYDTFKASMFISRVV